MEAEGVVTTELIGADRRNEDGKRRSDVALLMLESGDTAVTVKHEALPFNPRAMAVRNADGKVLGYLSDAIAEELEDAIGEEEIDAIVVNASEGSVSIVIDVTCLAVEDDYGDDDADDDVPADSPEEKKKNPLPGFIIIGVTALYLAYRLLTRGE
jgi:hypothetical protein